MATIQSQIELYDAFSAPMINIIRVVNLSISAMTDMRGVIDGTFNEISTTGAKNYIEQSTESVQELSEAMQGNVRDITESEEQQRQYNEEIQKGVGNTNKLADAVKGIVDRFATVDNVIKAMELSDQMVMTNARLDLIVDDGGSAEELRNKIFASAQSSGSSYSAMMDNVLGLGTQAPQAFSSNDELIAFTELLNKQFVNAGTPAQDIASVMQEITQSMAEGSLQGEAFHAIMGSASTIAQDMQRYLQEVEGVDASNMSGFAEEGQITAEMIKNAMFYSADEINKRFETMPKTFSQAWTSLQDYALMAFEPVLMKINEVANSTAFQNVVNGITEALTVAAGIALEVFDLMAAAGSFVAENWSIIEPIVIGIAAALGVYYGAMLLYNAVTAISTVVQNGFNAALSACPIVWVIILIIALIALFYAAVAAVNKFAGTSVSATGSICGGFMVALAVIGNIFIALWNLVVDVFALIYNLVAIVANYIGNSFIDPVGAVCRLFFDLADTVLGVLQVLAASIDDIFGSNLAESVQGWRDSLGGLADKVFGPGEEFMAKMDSSGMHLERFEYEAAWDTGYSFGQGIDEKIADFNPADLFNSNDIPSPGEYEYEYVPSGMGGEAKDIAGNTGAIRDSLEIAAEELKYLRDMAEEEAINRFTLADVHIEQTNHNNIGSEMDLDGVISRLDEALGESMEIMAEGGHM